MTALAALAFAGVGSSRPEAAAVRCPHTAADGTESEALAALTRLVPKEWAKAPWQGYIVTALFSLGPDRDPTMPGALPQRGCSRVRVGGR